MTTICAPAGRPSCASTWRPRTSHDYDTVIGTFAHPRYELMATGQVFDGEDEVRQYFTLSRTPFPDQRNELVSMRSHRRRRHRRARPARHPPGPLRGDEPTGRTFRSRMAALFIFEDGGDGIVCERVYFDSGDILRQLGLA